MLQCPKFVKNVNFEIHKILFRHLCIDFLLYVCNKKCHVYRPQADTSNMEIVAPNVATKLKPP